MEIVIDARESAHTGKWNWTVVVDGKLEGLGTNELSEWRSQEHALEMVLTSLRNNSLGKD